MSPAVEPSGLWRRLDQKIRTTPETGEDGQGIWDRLAYLVDPGEFRPKLSDDVEIKEFKLKWGNDYAIIFNPRDLLHYRLEPGEVEVVRLMDGTRTLKEIVVERLGESGDLELSGIADLMVQLHAGNFLDRRFLDVEEAVERALRPVSPTRERARMFATSLSIEWKNAERAVRWLYDHGLKHAFNRWAQIVFAAVVIAGMVAFVDLVLSGRFALTGESLALGFLILMALDYFSVTIHELGHALVLTHYGRRVKGAGFMIYFGSPAFFIEASDGLMLERRQRILQSGVGPYGEALVAGVAALIVWAAPGSFLSPTLYKFAVLGYVTVFMNLVPLLELDGYWILSDLIQVPDLRPRSLAFIRHDLWHKLFKRERFTKQEIGLGLYGFLGVAFTILSFYAAYFFWQQVFGDLVRRLWRGGAVTRILLVALIVVVTGPLIRAGINLLRSVGRRLRAVWHRVRFRLERKWRVEAAELIDALALFDDVPEDVLGELAGRVRLKTFGLGQPVVRQGERAAAFYVVRSGTLQVVEEDPRSGSQRVLRTLGRGESFGELGLAEAAPRSATVRALEESEVFEIEKGTFDRLLASMLHVPEFAPALQSLSELRELSCFSSLEPDELSELLERGEWINVAPGEAIVEEGELGDAFYGLRSGQVDVYQDGEHLRSLGPGSYFGEVALLLDMPRTATVVARTPVRAYRLDREGFDRLIGDAFKRGTLSPHVVIDRTWKH